MGIDVAVLASLIEFASATKDVLKSDRHSVDHSLGDTLSKVLRALYFPPYGVLSLLRKVDKGEDPTQEQIQKALIEFNDRQPAVERALEALDPKTLHNELRLHLRTVEVLQLVRFGKINLRQEIQQEINFYGQRGVNVDRKKVSALVQKIEELNKTIEEVEAIVNSRARSG